VARRSGTARTDRTRRRGVLLAAPAIAVIALVTLVPIAFSVYLSLSAVRPGVEGFEFTFVGLANYAEALQNPAVWEAFAFTGTYTVVSVTLQIALGLAVALAIDRMTRWAGITLAMLLIPWAMITVVSAQLWSYIFNGVYGIANYLLMLVGVIEAPVTFLGNPTGAFVALLVADTWKTVPFVALILFGGLRAIDKELYAAAKIDGAVPARILGQITIPLLRQSIITAVVFRVLQAFGLFDLPFVLTNGGPGTSTQSIAMLAYNALFQDLNVGYGAAIACLTTAIVAVFAILFLRTFKVDESHD